MSEKDNINEINDLPEKALTAMKESIAKEAGIPAEDIVFEGDVVRLLNGDVIGQIKTENIFGGATAVTISGKKFDKDKKAVITEEGKEPMDMLTKVLQDAQEVPKKMATVQIEGNKIVIEALDDIEDMVRKVRGLLKQVNKQLEDLQD